MLFGLVPFKTRPLFALMFVSPLSFFAVWYVRRRRFSLLLSLSQALGKPKPRLELGFPLVFLRPGRGLRARPVRLHFLLHQTTPSPCCFFSSASFVFPIWMFPGCSGWVVFLCGCLSGGGLLQAQTHRFGLTPHPLPAESCRGQPRKGVGEVGARQPYCHTMSGTCIRFLPLFEAGNAVPFFFLCFSCLVRCLLPFFVVLLFLGSLF